MNIQFATQFLLEEDSDKEALRERMVDYLVKYCGANKDAASMLSKAATDHVISFEKAIEICKATTGISEDGVGGSMTSGGVANGASFTPGAGMQYTTKKNEIASGTSINSATDYKIDGKDAIYKFTRDGKYYFQIIKGGEMVGIGDKELHRVELAEDAPMLAHGKADISTYIKDKFTKVEGHPKGLTIVQPKDLWGTPPTAMSETILKATKEKLDAILKVIKEKSPKIYDHILDLIADIYPHDDEVEALVAKVGLQENYNRFKKETKIRPKQDQYHEAIKVVNKKLDEVNRILEFTSRMKEELSEGEETLEVKARTAKSMDKLKTKIAEAYKKLKQLN